MRDFFSFTTDFDNAEPEETDPRHAEDFYTSVPFADDQRAALLDEPRSRVNMLVALACAENPDVFDYVAANVERIESAEKIHPKHARYVTAFHAAARVALETKAPALLTQWLAGVRSDEIRERVGAEIKDCMRPAQMIPVDVRDTSPEARRKANAALRAAGIPIKRGRPKKTC